MYNFPSHFIGEPFSRENGMINVGDKTVRGEVYKRFKDDIEFLFTPEGKSKWEGATELNTKTPLTPQGKYVPNFLFSQLSHFLVPLLFHKYFRLYTF